MFFDIQRWKSTIIRKFWSLKYLWVTAYRNIFPCNLFLSFLSNRKHHFLGVNKETGQVLHLQKIPGKLGWNWDWIFFLEMQQFLNVNNFLTFFINFHLTQLFNVMFSLLKSKWRSCKILKKLFKAISYSCELEIRRCETTLLGSTKTKKTVKFFFRENLLI